MAKKKHWTDWVWDAWCISSGIGIWPRFIEPNWLSVNRLTLPISHLPSQLSGLTILQISDLHWSNAFPSVMKRKLIQKVNRLQPDLICFTGDLICRSHLENPEGLKHLLRSLKAKIGCYAVLGNHDYSRFVSVSEQGDYDVSNAELSGSTISKGFRRLFHTVSLTGQVTPEARSVEYHKEVVQLFEQTPFQLLNNDTTTVTIKGEKINICGTEEYSTGRFDPAKAFRNYDRNSPGIVLSHNPDALMQLRNYPGDVILSGHTHGGQTNIPWLWKRLTAMENYEFKRGLKLLNHQPEPTFENWKARKSLFSSPTSEPYKWAYINRGISSVMKFRWFATPELTLITLIKG